MVRGVTSITWPILRGGFNRIEKRDCIVLSENTRLLTVSKDHDWLDADAQLEFRLTVFLSVPSTKNQNSRSA